MRCWIAIAWWSVAAARVVALQGTALSLGQKPNQLWCTDYKGEFLLGNHQYCYPLTVTDHASRFLLTCEALSSTKEEYPFTVFERLFKERGLPANIRSDNGVPFASAHALFNLSKLAVVAAVRHRHRTNQARPPSAKRPS
jgi:transposase InsO family protein